MAGEAMPLLASSTGAGALHEALQPWEIFLVIQHIGHHDQVQLTGYGKIVPGDAQLDIVEPCIVSRGPQRKRVDVAGDYFGGPGEGRRHRNHA